MFAPQSFCRFGSPDSILDERRRELYKYFQPESFKKETPETPKQSPDPILTSYAQLATWRLDARRCTISLFDKDTQYNVAEATKTLSLEDGMSAEKPEDELWLGCSSFSAEGSICLHTLAATASLPTGDGEFEVTDLAADERFKSLPFVTGYPRMRYYYGLTFSTRRKIKIGTLCILDDKPRKPMSEEQRVFLNIMASNVFSHLELMRERAERKRSLKMNQCLNLFMTAETTFPGKRKRKSGFGLEMSSRCSRTSSISSALRRGAHQRSEKEQKSTTQSSSSEGESVKHEHDEPTTDQEDEPNPAEEDNHLRVFAKAAELLRTSLDLEEGGGVVFFDTANAGQDASWAQTSSQTTRRPNQRGNFRGVRRGSTCTQTAAEVLASSTTCEDMDEVESPKEPGFERAFTALSVDTMATFIERYPQGKLWVFDSDGHIVSDSEDDLPSNEARLEAEAAILLNHFPGACQIISLPLWDPRSTRWAVCFVYSTSKYRTLTYETEFLHCVAFSNCITIEMGRLATMASDKLKGDFISSISHELRSPLHGILASVEFLQEETDTNSFQQSLVHTVGSCARTLLDTISMILDYTKINAFERDWKRLAKTKKGVQQPLPGEASIPGGLTAQGQPTLNIYGNVDLAAVTEEVVEGVTAGQQHHDILTVDFSYSGSKMKGPFPKNINRRLSVVATDGKQVVAPAAPTSKGQVELILDIEPRTWNYVTQPGAFRRVVMNLVGNALKYTSSGWIRVHLTVESNGTDTTQILAGAAERDMQTDMVVLTVTDTGRGISPEYLRTKLFTAFAQEDHLASGTGLGLSLVRSILKMLNGDIDITSTLGSGTTAVARIPMIPQSGNGTPLSGNTPSTGSSTSETVKNDSVAALKKVAEGKRIALYSPPVPQRLVKGFDIRTGVFNKIRKYTVQWCHLTLVEWSPECIVDVIITDEDDLESLLAEPHCPNRTSILVYCLYTARPGLVKKYASRPLIDFMSKPFGPYKLARALRVCLERGAAVTHSGADTVPEGENTQVEAEHAMVEGTLSSHGIEVNVVEAGGVVGRDDSANAHMAMDDSDHGLTSGTLTESADGQEFPFTISSSDPITSPSFALRPALKDRRTMSPTVSEMKKIQKDMGYFVSPVTIAGEVATTRQPTNLSLSKIMSADNTVLEPETARDPRLLLVDDNTINLRLLQTFMKKRKYTDVLSAKDGLEAVNAFGDAASSGYPPDIVFMDISMPVMNGFEATRRIRAMEEAANASVIATEARPRALIVALTGLASGKDQGEAFLAGVDLYMTKPVSFKEVGRLLDNWVRNSGPGREGLGVPHGAVTGGWTGQGAKVE